MDQDTYKDMMSDIEVIETMADAILHSPNAETEGARAAAEACHKAANRLWIRLYKHQNQAR